MSGPDLLTLIGRDGPLKRKGSTHGGEYVSPCTICRRGKGRPNGRDHFIAWPNAANGPGKPPGRWACLGPKAGRSGCDLSGDAIQYLRERDGLSYGEACPRLGVTPGVHVDGRGSGARQGEGTRSGGGQVRRDGEVVPAGPCAPTTMSPLMPPPAAWQERGAYHAARCAAHLWGEEGGGARAYLQGRGLFDGVLRAFQVAATRATCMRSAACGAWRRAATGSRCAGIALPWRIGAGCGGSTSAGGSRPARWRRGRPSTSGRRVLAACCTTPVKCRPSLYQNSESE